MLGTVRSSHWTIVVLISSGVAMSGVMACGDSKCFLDCVSPPAGCHVEGANDSTDCGKASCGTIVCPMSDAGDAAGAPADARPSSE
jgi:hypothetical protein